MTDQKRNRDDETPDPLTVIANAIKVLAEASANSNNNSQVAEAIEALRASQPPRRLTFDEFVPQGSGRKGRGIEAGADDAGFLPFYQNGSQLRTGQLNDKSLALLPRIRPGKFINGMMTVVERERNGVKQIHFIYKSASLDDRMASKSEWRNLTEMLQRCVDEAEGVATSA